LVAGWFQDEFAVPINVGVLEQLRAVDWEQAAEDVEVQGRTRCTGPGPHIRFWEFIAHRAGRAGELDRSVAEGGSNA
jgi:hypothetical protein